MLTKSPRQATRRSNEQPCQCCAPLARVHIAWLKAGVTRTGAELVVARPGGEESPTNTHCQSPAVAPVIKPAPERSTAFS
jgi:hypothetical protein